MLQDRTKLWYLKNIDIFANMRDEEYSMIDRLSEMKEIERGEILYLQGSSDKNIYILKKGAVKITKLTPQGREIILDIIKGGSIFGEMAHTDPREHDESAEAIEDSLICILKKEDFNKLLNMVPGLAIRLTKMIGFRRWKIENKLIDLLYCTVEKRLVKTILNLLEDFGIPHNGGYLLKIKLTHKDFADLIASTRETVTATLSKLKDQGYINFEGKYLTVSNVEKLSELLN
ncbi:cyclic nucleotide-binding protein [Dissulfurispira thermophila]|uniref:Cyclic nucleotide-binding protein n=2 Tax=root TaxID=1 RepID=A0A7G1GYN7_9BACT|nr:Crp/Fnr family transcriptional regulator [Dissulfurispira thermophila]BCB95580.1 cyclic nucleotide-binding protein [Dissulfurispira thermophila]